MAADVFEQGQGWMSAELLTATGSTRMRRIVIRRRHGASIRSTSSGIGEEPGAPLHLSRAQHWRSRAEDAQSLAEDMNDAEAYRSDGSGINLTAPIFFKRLLPPRGAQKTDRGRRQT